ncbi:hydroxymethylbilane synthase [Propioniciclava sp. MC1683]|nr:hydroxymethylbilane synthase [Propioniciclava sp. MC1683]
MKLRLGTRGSELARTQSGHVAAALTELGHEVELVTIRSEGDVTSGSLLEAGGLGVFAAALRRALLEGEVDLVVHSLKDLPTAPVEGLVIAAVPERELPFDALCARDGLRLQDLSPLARVGTGSPRRAAQLRARRPDLTVVEIRGNVGTRLARVHGDATTQGDLDAVVLARAGLARLGRYDAATDTLDLLPAPGQGALAVECRSVDISLREALAELDHAETRACVTAERRVLAELEAGCAAPVGAYARFANGHLEFTAAVFNAEGTESVTARRSVPADTDPDALGREVAADLLAQGAAAVTPLGATRESQLEDFHHEKALWAPGTVEALVGRRVLLPRPEGPLAQAIRAAGAEVDAVPVTETRPLPFALPGRRDWLVLTSPVGVRMLTEAEVDLTDLADRIAVVGPATAAAVEATGARVDLVPPTKSDADALLAALPQDPASVLLAGSALASPRLADGLAERGWDVEVVHTYTTATVTDAPDVLAWADYDAVLVTAGSIARAVVDLLGMPDPHVAVVTLGEPSAAASDAVGLRVDAVAATQDGPGVVDALIRALTEENR